MRIIILFGILSLFITPVFSQDNNPNFISTATMVERPSLSSQLPFAPMTETRRKSTGKKNKRWINYPTNFDALPKGKDALIQSEQGTKKARSPEQNFEAAQQEGAYSAWSVPDPTGAVGPNHFIHAYNSGFVIFDKEGNTLMPHASLGVLWPGETYGDPVVLYDRYIERFIITQFSDSPNAVLFAICQGPDPVNDDWFTYRFNLDAFPDYPKYSIWHDAYYITANKFYGNVLYAVERDKMAIGETTAQIVGFDLPSNTSNSATVFAALAMNSVGPNLPDASVPGYIVYLQDDAWGGVSEDHLKIWEVTLDWANTTNSVISLPEEIITTPFDSFTATFGSGEVPQPGTGQKIDGITGVVSYMCNYWNYGTHNAATLNFNVDVNNDNTILGIRWFELRENAGDWSIYQEGTYAPNDGLYRFMGSMSLDINGNIGMGFNVGNSTTYPSIRYTGRFANDPLGEMTIAEEVIMDGTGSRTNLNRFGDYAQLTIDPTDNKTFWHTAEYVRAGGNWSNRVASFRIAPNFANDTGVTNIVAPVSGILTNSETISITIFNYGEEEQSNFDVSYQIDGGAVITETFTGTIPSATAAEYVFATTADFSIEGHIYSVLAQTSLSNDEDTANDAITQNITYIAHNDIGVTEIISPTSGSNLGMETITVRVENFGYDEQSNFDISYKINNNAIVTEQVSGPLAGGESLTYSFSTQGNFSSPRSYNLAANTDLANDINNTNDKITVLIDNYSCYQKSINTNQPIGPNPITVYSNITIPQDHIVHSLRVKINISHDRASDLDLYLISPDGTRVELTTDNGGTGNDYIDTIFDDEASQLITAGTAPFTGTYKPEGSLADFIGLPTLGTWQLEMTDDETGESGTLHTWELDICGTTSLAIYDNVIDASDLIVKSLGKNRFIISLATENSKEKLSFKVFDIFGKKLIDIPLLQQNGAYTYPLDMDSYASGVYIIRLGNDSFGKVKRILVK